ncbi:helix-turn-helix domain-containing protein [Bifidobacterium sp. SMB2]|uniref:Helix-turn-helix domain-containing protein n=1 Tax=Bifidobacterium saimiriisciurei TaxID=2661627 RepID=A0ABX0CDR0_9BIFI|nr:MULTISPECIES: AraC family transcriptional regulator [Bifidobacterium]NEG95652.1 helix-turn-helix domain-containing protein [Bifidobacterium sp. SMB2]NEH11965.1 helix-turn-helix domain-containing protein [Bifidobacterium saimiriisciurei]
MTHQDQPRAVIVNSMISDRFEIYHVDSQVVEHAQLHYHDFHEINCVLRGTGVFHLGGKEYTTGPGTVTFAHSNDLHNIVRQSSDYYERAYIYVRDDFLASRSTSNTNLAACFSNNGKPASRVITMEPDALRREFATLDEKPGNGYGEDLEYEQRFLNFMVTLNKAVADSSTDVAPVNKPVSSLITNVMEYVSENLDGDCSLDHIAGRFFINKYYLSRQFKKSTGLNLHEFILKRRLLRSKELLREYGSAQNVYRQCGFASYTHFLRCFKQEFHMTTKEFLSRNDSTDVVYFTAHE